MVLREREDRWNADINGMVDRICGEIIVQRGNWRRHPGSDPEDWRLVFKPLALMLRQRTPEEAAHALWLVLCAVRCYNQEPRASVELEGIVQSALNKLRATK